LVENLEGVLVPKTVLVRLENIGDLWHVFDNHITEGFAQAVEQVQQAGDSIGYPCFLKTGQFSGKHEWQRTCHVPDRESVLDHMRSLSHFAEIVGCTQSLVFAVREFIPTIAAFHAFYGKMPVTKGRRYFVREGDVVFHHPYWPPFTIEEPTEPDWEKRLEELNAETQAEVELLTELTQRVGQALGGEWSVDWLQAADGQWYLIDMAVLRSSFMWAEYEPAFGKKDLAFLD
jgi:hypothetical protein